MPRGSNADVPIAPANGSLRTRSLVAISNTFLRDASNSALVVQEEQSREYSPDDQRGYRSDFGLDMVRVTGPIDLEAETKAQYWARTASYENREGDQTSQKSFMTIEVGRGEIRLEREIRDPESGSRGSQGFVEFNPSCFCSDDELSLCPPEALFRVISEVLDRAGNWMCFTCGPADLRVNRLDVARNIYGVTDPGRTLLGLRSLPRRYKPITELTSSGPVPETLTLRTKRAGGVRLYDKYAESRGMPSEGAAAEDRLNLGVWTGAPKGMMRFEVEARGGANGWLRRYGNIELVSDLNELNLRRLMKNRADWAMIEAVIMDEWSTVDQVFNLGLSCGTERGLLRYMLSLAKGKQPSVSEQTRKKYEDLIRKHKLSIVLNTSDAIGRRLDLKEGREVLIDLRAG